MKTDHWRLIITPPLSGGWNMAFDEIILNSVNNGKCLPTLRLFAWQPYCLSLGHAQSVSDVDVDALNRSGWGLVRRPTGGRAILHADELTYSVSAPLNNPHVLGGVLESYRRISACLLEALDMLGIQADSLPKNEEEKKLSKDPVCFQYPSDYEITFQGKKLIGSAQARRSNALLQHGAIPLCGDLTRITSVLKFNSENDRRIAQRSLADRAATIQEARGKTITWQETADALISAFEKVFSIKLVQEDFKPSEKERANECYKEKYNHLSWTYRI